MSVVKSLSVGMGCMHQEHETIVDINKHYETITPSHAKIKELKLKGDLSILQARIHRRTKWLHAHVPRIQTRNIFQPIIFPSSPLSISTFHIHFPYLSIPSTPGKTVIRCDLSHRYRCSSSEIQLSCRSSAWKDKKSGTHVPDTGYSNTGSCLVWLDRAWKWIIMHLSVSVSLSRSWYL